MSSVDESIDPVVVGADGGADVIALPYVRRSRLGPRRRLLVTEALHGLALTLAFGVLLAYGNQHSGWYGVVLAAGLAALWLASGRAARHLVPAALGSTAVGAVGAGLGLVAVSSLSVWVAPLAIGGWTMVAMAAAAAALAVVRATAVPGFEPCETRVLVVGGGAGTDRLLEDVVARGDARFRVVAVVSEDPVESPGEAETFDSITALPGAISQHEPDLVVVAAERGRIGVFRALLDLAGSDFRIVGVPEFYEHAFGRVPVSHLTPAWFMSLLHLYQRPYTRFSKRIFDVAVASAALLLTLPIFLIALIAVGRSPIYRQERLGEGGRTFTMLKFRTMRKNAEEPGLPVFATVGDPRITNVGRILRRTRLDELPQLWNVLLGHMSIVGPRPERPEFYATLAKQVPFWTRRHVVKPGITGWAQINAGYADDAVTTTEKLSYDLWYLRHRSFLTDLVICARTLPKFVSGNGAR
ncbi:MAG TPA: sugar transferase [Gaiellaceae bacterium]|jgi:exopolysaccharide biosynthesis polyprenyl glycosylphosphotransferase